MSKSRNLFSIEQRSTDRKAGRLGLRENLGFIEARVRTFHTCPNRRAIGKDFPIDGQILRSVEQSGGKTALVGGQETELERASAS